MRSFILTSCIILSACSTTYTKPVERPALNLSHPPPFKLDDIRMRVIHKHNADKYFNEKDSSGKEPVVVSLTVQDYKKLSVTLSKLKAYIKAQKKIIDLYKTYYEGEQNGNKE